MPTASAAPSPALFPPPRPGGETGDPRAHDWSAVLRWLEEGHGFLLTTHVNPDADGLGSLAALAHSLRERGRRVLVVLPSPMPEFCRFLLAELDAPVHEDPSRVPAEELAGLDRAVILDVSGRERIGAVAGLLDSGGLPCLVLDHHLSNEAVDPFQVVFPGLSSTGELLGALLGAWGAPPTPAVARSLYAALTSDTGGFAFACTTGDTLELAAALVRAGAQPARIHDQLNQNYPAARFDLLARFLATRRSHAEGRLAEFELSLAMLRETGAAREDSEGFVNLGLSIRGCCLSLLFCELEDGRTKVNFRCVEPYDVCALARELGGGGHRLAAGATVAAPLAELRPRVLELALAQLRER
ncbi:MAG: bifunctional oligoribonuclease/PAP phosphatase NrnA [Candidatus Delongbacteria bacterium]